MYDLIYIGDSLESPSLSSISVDPEQLISVRGEIGDFNVRYKNGDSQPQEVKTGSIVINIEAEKDNPLPERKCFTDDLNQEDWLSESDYLVFLQDYNGLSPAVMSKLGLEKVLELNKEYPDLQIYYFYRSMRFIDDNDRLFDQAREEGIVFIKFEEDGLQITDDGELHYEREDLEFDFDGNIVVAPDLKPAESLKRVARILNIEMSDKGYLQAENVYLQPTLTGKRGIYALGGARGPNGYSEVEADIEFTLNEIEARKDEVEPIDELERVVDDQKCILCYNCYRICPHGAIEPDEELDAMKINNLACEGCNACISRCPAAAISIVDEEEKATISGLKVIICENSAEIAYDKFAEKIEMDMETVPCTGSIKKEDLYRDLRDRNNRILILGCFEDSCKHINGDHRGEQVVNQVKETMEKLNLDEDRLSFKRLSHRMSEDVGRYLARWKEGKE
ncbi:MAG: hydrogenase iron-sulfur subunit [Halanaerobiales bacterium]